MEAGGGYGESREWDGGGVRREEEWREGLGSRMEVDGNEGGREEGGGQSREEWG